MPNSFGLRSFSLANRSATSIRERLSTISVRLFKTDKDIFFDPLLILAKFDQAKPRWRFVFTPSLDLDTFGLKKIRHSFTTHLALICC